MKLIALSLAILGIVTGLFFVLGPWIFGTPTGAVSTFIGPTVVGATLCAVPWFTLQRIRSGRGKRVGLLVWNGLALAFMMLGGVLARRYGIGGPYATTVFVFIGLLYVLPLTSNVIFLAVNGRAETKLG
jgi:hypothetical protein